MARGNVPAFGQAQLGQGSRPSGPGGQIPAGQGSNAQLTKGGPSAERRLGKHTQGRNGETTVNSQPMR